LKLAGDLFFRGGQIPHDLGLLTDLTFLSLYENKLSGTIPSSLDARTALEILSLTGNKLTGTIPSSLGALTALTKLQPQGNQLAQYHFVTRTNHLNLWRPTVQKSTAPVAPIVVDPWRLAISRSLHIVDDARPSYASCRKCVLLMLFFALHNTIGRYSLIGPSGPRQKHIYRHSLLVKNH
jgi:hypothetical protein